MMIYSIATLLVLGLLVGTGLAVAARKFYVEEDPRVTAVMEVLPGANCGGCGFAGCSGYATAVVNDPAIPANRCCAGGSDCADKVAKITGKVVEASIPHYSFRTCSKQIGNVKPRYLYLGMQTCAAVNQLENGADRCQWACLGFGDCVRACNFNAITIEDGVANILPDACTGCGACVSACPRHVLDLVPANMRVAILCSSHDKMKAVTDVCTAGCIQCLKCVKACPAKAISVKNSHVTVDYDACTKYPGDCGMACVPACPRKVLQPIRLSFDEPILLTVNSDVEAKE